MTTLGVWVAHVYIDEASRVTHSSGLTIFYTQEKKTEKKILRRRKDKKEQENNKIHQY
jgi:hypothetical protein